MSTTVTTARLGPSDLAHLLTLGGRLFMTEASTPCKDDVGGNDLWFSPHRDREQAARRCLDCPFLGRCGYNAVISRATHGVWAGRCCPATSRPNWSPSTAACSISSRIAARPNSATRRPLPCRKTLRGADVAHNWRRSRRRSARDPRYRCDRCCGVSPRY